MSLSRAIARAEADQVVTSFISTYHNKVDRKGRVSVPAQFREKLADFGCRELVAYPSPWRKAIESLPKTVFDKLMQSRTDRDVEEGEFERVLFGDSRDIVVETMMGLATPLPIDSEGRVLLPSHLLQHAGIEGRATFAGRGQRIQIWSPENHQTELDAALEKLRSRHDEEDE